MVSPAVQRAPATLADLLAIPPEERFHEIIDGELVRKATPTFEHGDAQSGIASHLKGPFQRRPGGRGPGGWWIGTEVEVENGANQVYRPDVVGWRRERVPERPTGTPVRIRPDWVCEVLSPSDPVLAANGDARVRAEPFEAVELPLRTLFGEEDEDE